MGTERLLKISRQNILPERRSPGHPKRRWGDLIPCSRGGFAYNKEEEEEEEEEERL